MAEPQNLDVPFPVGGMEVSVAYGDQPPNTTPLGVNVRSYDPILDRRRGGCRVGLSKFADQIPAGTHLIQHLAELVDPRADNLIGSFEDFMPDFVVDPRNAARRVPLHGSGSMTSVGWPPAAFRRVQATASSTTPTDGDTVTITSTLTAQPANTPIAGQTITLATIPRGRDGDGDSAVTNGSGIATFTVSEATFEGSVVYFAANQYHRAGIPFPSVARGIVTVAWRPNYSLAVTSPDGTTLPGDGKSHPLVATLTKTGVPVPGRSVLVQTSPSGKPGDGFISVTNPSGQVTAKVSDTVNESVVYTASMLPGMAITGNKTVNWTVPPPPAPPVPPGTPMTLGPPTGYSGPDFPGGSTVLFLYTVGSKAPVPVSLGIAGVEIAITGNSDLGVTIAPNVTTDGSGNATFQIPEPSLGNVINPVVTAYVVSNPAVAASMAVTPFAGKGAFAWL